MTPQRKWTLADRLKYYASVDRNRGCVRAIAARFDDMRTPAQLGALRRLSADGECQKIFGVDVEQLSKGAASALIEFVKSKG